MRRDVHRVRGNLTRSPFLVPIHACDGPGEGVDGDADGADQGLLELVPFLAEVVQGLTASDREEGSYCHRDRTVQGADGRGGGDGEDGYRRRMSWDDQEGKERSRDALEQLLVGSLYLWPWDHSGCDLTDVPERIRSLWYL